MFTFQIKRTLQCAVVASLFTSGCASYDHRAQDESNPAIVSVVEDLISKAKTQKNPYESGTMPTYLGVSLYDYADTIALKLSQQYVPRDGVIVASFVNLDSTLQTTHPLGNQLSESLKAALSNAGYKIVDANAAETIQVSKKGIFGLEREPGVFNGARYLVAGTLVYNERGVSVNTRLIEIDKKVVKAANKIMLPALLFDH